MMAAKTKKARKKTPKKPTLKRNDRLYDLWSLVHFLTGVLFGWLMNPYVALIIMIAWEPIEIFGLSKLLAKRGIVFGHEAFINSFSDIVVDVLGILVGIWFTTVSTPVAHLF